ncbi:hypothetical protein SAMN04488505_10337 [Chitinophaga rupis]|uniref:Uncharacterized protein n=2 Tax=Chitinophaga rupis TaxID=573321 RepID=A0A1H7UM03_9BACT|nr:hypothetical protein SAMN04488505_10337 [Chitinophaga rupis]
MVDSTYFLTRTGCKSMLVVPIPPYPLPYNGVKGIRMHGWVIPTQVSIPPQRKPFLVVHGNVMYDLYYQSNADTPYLEKDLYQHTLQTYLDITVKDQYPLRVAFSTQQGNSSLFRNITGMNLQYTNRDFKNALLQKAQKWDAGQLQQWGELDTIKKRIADKVNEINRLKDWSVGPSRIQQLVEARERELYGRAKDSLHGKLPSDSLQPGKADTALQRIKDGYTENAKRIDSLQQQLAKWQQLYREKQQLFATRRQQLTDVLINSRNNRELANNLEALNLPDTILPKGYRTLLAVRSVGVGRTMVDYSELTAKNISITGFQAEYNPSYYVAVATGAVDYRFRDFVVNDNRISQYLNMVRVGTGMKEGNNIILSFYTGKKQVYNFNTDSSNTTKPDYHIMGLALEGRWQLNKDHYMTGEVAKSSMPYYMRSTHDQGAGNSMLSFNDHSNEAFAVTANSFIPVTGTRLSAMYKRMGANFQSFSLYSTGASQTGWLLKADQPFFKQQLMITASLRQNVYTSILDNASYRSSTVFKSVQATFRRRRWPVVSVGYFPSSQLMKLGEGKFIENLFYTMVGTASYFYEYRGISMNTIFSGTRFYNHQTDSSFVYFNSTNLMLNHTVFLGKFTVNGSLSSATNQDYALYGADGNLQYRITSWLEVGGGIKYNYQTQYNLQQTGYTANARVNVPKVGEIALMADKGFVPGVNRQLVANKTGRLTYTKIF